MISGTETQRRLHVIREEYARGWGAAKRAAKRLDLSHALVRQIAHRAGIRYERVQCRQ